MMYLEFVASDMFAQTSDRRQYVLAAVVAVSVLFLLYSLLIANQPFAGLGFLVFLFVLYLAYRFVRAHERIADALETRDERPDSER